MLSSDRYFDWRGKDVSRLEGFSDAAFAMTLTLLAVSSVVPRSFEQLFEIMKDFFAFTITFAVLIMIWVEHYLFFRRYGIRDGYTITLNSVLLLLVLFYVYPLKFMTTSLIKEFFGIGTGVGSGGADMTGLMVFYSAGYLAIFLIFTLLYLHAWRSRDSLDLGPAEQVLTRCGIRSALIHVAFGTTSILIALSLPAGFLRYSGMIYFLIGPVMFVHGMAMGRAVEKAWDGS